MKSIQRSFLTPRYVITTVQLPPKFTTLVFRYSEEMRNAIQGNLCRAERLLSNFNNEKMLIRQKFDNADYPSPFTNSVIRNYEHKQNRRQQQENEYIIPVNFFGNCKRMNIGGVSILPTE